MSNASIAGPKLHPEMIGIIQKMGKSPVAGYRLWDCGDSWELQAVKRGGFLMRSSVRLPKDPDDMIRVVHALLACTHGKLSAMAIIAAATE